MAKGYPTGQYLRLGSRNQDERRFASIMKYGKVVKGTEVNPDRMRVRVYEQGHPKGDERGFVRITDSIWLENVGASFRGRYLPSVHEVLEVLTVEQFNRILESL